MQLSAPTVHEMVGRLERDGYITRAADKSISFTDEGLEHAETIVRRHRLIERFLTDVLKIPWDDVHEEAERLEHAMSPVLEARMLAAIGDAKTCPHGHPIEPGTRIEGVPLGDTVEGAKITVLRFENEAEDLLHLFMAEGLEPGPRGRGLRRRRRAHHGRLQRRHRDADPQRGRDGERARRPVAAAADRAPRAARARQRALRPIANRGDNGRDLEGARPRPTVNGMSLHAVTSSNFTAEVIESDKPVLVDFTAAWCPPCRAMNPILDQMAAERDDIKIVSVDVDTEQELASQWGVMGMPTFLLFQNGAADPAARRLAPAQAPRVRARAGARAGAGRPVRSPRRA